MALTAYQALSQDWNHWLPDALRSHDGVARSPKLENRKRARPAGAVSNDPSAVAGFGAAPSLIR